MSFDLLMCTAVLARRNSLRFGVLEMLRALHKPMRRPVMIIRCDGFLEFAASHRGACGFALQHSSVRHCVRVMAESRDTMNRMDEFPVGVVYSK
jgi:hypothetical protein